LKDQMGERGKKCVKICDLKAKAARKARITTDPSSARNP
jgi:hypothetical protein